MNNKEIKKWIQDKNKKDTKNNLNPIYSIITGSPYECKEMFNDVEELMIAVAETFYEKGKNEIEKITKELKNKFKECKKSPNYNVEYGRGITHTIKFIKVALTKEEVKD